MAGIVKEVLEGGRVKGGMLHSHVEWVTAHRPPGALDEIRRLVSPATAKLLEGAILPIGWYPFRALIETDRAIAAQARAADPREIITELGRYSARLNLTTTYRVYSRAQPHEFFRAAAQLHSRFQDFGRAQYEAIGPTSCRLSMLDYRCFSEAFCWSAIGYYEQATVLQGGREPRVRETQCVCRGDGACHFEVAWS